MEEWVRREGCWELVAEQLTPQDSILSGALNQALLRTLPARFAPLFSSAYIALFSVLASALRLPRFTM